MSNHHLRNKNLSLKAKGLLSQMLSLPDDWDYTLKGLAAINKESVDAIRTAIWELEDAGYVVRTRVRDERGCLRGCDYYVYEYPQTPSSGSGGSAESVPPMLEPLASDSAVLGNPMQLNKEIQNLNFSKRPYRVRFEKHRIDRTGLRRTNRDTHRLLPAERSVHGHQLCVHRPYPAGIYALTCVDSCAPRARQRLVEFDS